MVVKEVLSKVGTPTDSFEDATLGFVSIFVDTESKLQDMLTILEASTCINVDFEGIDLQRNGEVCLGQFHASRSGTVYVVDFCTMKPFSMCEERLKTILESSQYTKVVFDPRNDSDAIFHQFGVMMKNVLCLQLAEIQYRRNSGLWVNYVTGLSKTMDRYLNLSHHQRQSLLKIKDSGVAMFAPEKGGTYQVFKERPLAQAILAYAAADVYYFDALKDRLYETLPKRGKEWVLVHSKYRVLECTQSGYLAKGRHKALAPH
jgi:exonuclease 3'-5' domain-containing protein 1